jgi:hypothetical protein
MQENNKPTKLNRSKTGLRSSSALFNSQMYDTISKTNNKGSFDIEQFEETNRGFLRWKNASEVLFPSLKLTS